MSDSALQDALVDDSQDTGGSPDTGSSPDVVPVSSGGPGTLAQAVASTQAAQNEPAISPDITAGAQQPDVSNLVQSQQPDDMPRFHRTFGNTLRGMLMGLVTNGARGAIAGGISPTGVQRAADQQQALIKAQVDKAQGEAKFANAQAAHETAQATMADKQLQHWDEQYQNQYTNQQLETLDNAQKAGWSVVGVTQMDQGTAQNTQNAMNTMNQVAGNSPGGKVPAGLLHLHVGDRVITLQQNDPAASLDLINQQRRAQGLTPIDRGQFLNLGADAVRQMSKEALQFEMPLDQNGQVTQASINALDARLQTVKAHPEVQGQADMVKRLQQNLDFQKSVLQHEQDLQNKANATKIQSDAAAVASTEKGRADIQHTKAETSLAYAEAKKSLAEAGNAGTQKMWDYGVNNATGEKLNLSNAPDEFLVDSHTGQPIPQKMLSTLKPTQQESNRSDFASSVIHSLDQIDQLRAAGKLPNGPLSGLTAKVLAKAGLGDEDAQKALNFISFAQSAATGAHVGGRFNVPIMEKMGEMIKINMNDSQFKGAEDSIRDVMGQYVKQGGRETVGQYKQNLLGSVVSVKGQRVKVTGFDKNGNVIGVPVQ